MFVTRNMVNFFLPAEEKQIISSLLHDPWKGIYAQSGKILIQQLVEPHTYSVGPVLIETNKSRILILLDSKELDDGNELLRLAIVTDQDELQEMLSKMHPPIKELINVPNDLNIESFFGIVNEVFLLRFSHIIRNGINQINVTTESGLLISNSDCRLLLYPNKEIPMDFCITTDADKINKVLKGVDVIPFRYKQ